MSVSESFPSSPNHSSNINLFNTDCPPCAGPLFPDPCDVPDEKVEYMVWASRGFWWNPMNALDDVVPVGKNPKVGDDGGEK